MAPPEPEAMRAFGPGIERTFAFLSIRFDAALNIRLRPANWLEGFFREFHAKANEIGAYPNEIIRMTVFLLIVWMRRLKRNPQ
jgi:hypothetical protein